jgi:hypothetical protein
MAVGLGEKLDRKLFRKWFRWQEKSEKPWKILRKHGSKWHKKSKNRVERHKANINPECIIGYKKYKGWEY